MENSSKNKKVRFVPSIKFGKRSEFNPYNELIKKRNDGILERYEVHKDRPESTGSDYTEIGEDPIISGSGNYGAKSLKY